MKQKASTFLAKALNEGKEDIAQIMVDFARERTKLAYANGMADGLSMTHIDSIIQEINLMPYSPHKVSRLEYWKERN